MDNKVLFIVRATLNPDDMESFNAYIQKLTALYKENKVEQLAHYPIREIFVGKEAPSFLAIFMFPSKEAVDAVYESEDYKQTMLPLRQKGFLNLEVYIS